MKIDVNTQIYISTITPDDQASYIAHMQDREIYEKTIGIPYPYGENEAKWWIAAVAEEAKRFGQPLQYAIRTEDGALIGGIGLMDMKSSSDHAAELGFWLARNYRNKGIMTNCIKAFTNWAFNNPTFGLVRIQCRIFAHNEVAVKIVEKCQFVPEGYMRKRFKKDDKYIDAKIFALVR
ncbi:MAG: hypothetical protein A2381_16930 [Bdellovibrionales bacterium RIFOXYB1_FULL_37_110]|nr:MAG: hypothetical protein A2181_07935 [Bdellovibrionales bacterium RIFOXYA1_FULL_38_20]OFZ50083.1 MAG: hypothetical protein A2417_18765 [Bdellovibrionales bacterium RIFOXYC1_FULL_37_79]OFZ59989.1 MAG: hypothetical protein A2381_16930 [Bdellovibrionales bacterium RIFOXYB1_FULL_37_110]OFZ64288.1 MAG: hypothetical protein A2577_12725 [Bdellovibrionales bacterium RIFOXYD1_FULL_36_51]